MSKPVSIEQSHAVMQALSCNIHWDALDGEILQQIIRDPKRFGHEFTALLARGGTLPGSLGKPKSYSIFRTIQVGTFKSIKALKKALRDAEITVSEWAEDNMAEPGFRLEKEGRELDLVVRSNNDLGLADHISLYLILNAAREAGLELCPPEVGPQLRLQYMDQPEGEELVVPMEDLSQSGRSHSLFSLSGGKYKKGLWLTTHESLQGGSSYDCYGRFLFVQPRK